MMEANKLALREFLSRYTSVVSLNDDEPLLRSGLLNSLAAMQLVLFVERHFQITVANHDLTVDNFASVNAINTFVIKKQEGPPSMPRA